MSRGTNSPNRSSCPGGTDSLGDSPRPSRRACPGSTPLRRTRRSKPSTGSRRPPRSSCPANTGWRRRASRGGPWRRQQSDLEGSWMRESTRRRHPLRRGRGRRRPCGSGVGASRRFEKPSVRVSEEIRSERSVCRVSSCSRGERATSSEVGCGRSAGRWAGLGSGRRRGRT